MSLNVGILSIQGDVQENLLSTKAAFDELGITGNITRVKTPDEISKLDGLIIPGFFGKWLTKSSKGKN